MVLIKLLGYIQLVNNVEVITVNTCTCIDVFTVITTKDQSGRIYDSYSTGGQGFMAVVNKFILGLHPRTQSVYCHISLALCYNYYINHSVAELIS